VCCKLQAAVPMVGIPGCITVLGPELVRYERSCIHRFHIVETCLEQASHSRRVAYCHGNVVDGDPTLASIYSVLLVCAHRQNAALMVPCKPL